MIIRSFAPLGTPFIEHRVCNFSVSTVFLRSLALLGRSRSCTKTGVDVSPVAILAQDLGCSHVRQSPRVLPPLPVVPRCRMPSVSWPRVDGEFGQRVNTECCGMAVDVRSTHLASWVVEKKRVVDQNFTNKVKPIEQLPLKLNGN